MRSHGVFVANDSTDIVTTPSATVRADASFTGLGNENSFFIPQI